MREESDIFGGTTGESDSAANKFKVGEIFLLKDCSQILNCIQCSREFLHFTEFTLHVQEHYLNGKIVPLHPKFETEIDIEEVLIKIEPENGFEGSASDYIENYDTQLYDPVDEFVCSTTEKIEIKPQIKEEVEKDESENFTFALCGWVCKEKRYLRSHITSHSDSRVRCEICDKKITAKNMKGHMKLHTSTREFFFAVCGMCFTNKGNLKLHHDPRSGL